MGVPEPTRAELKLASVAGRVGEKWLREGDIWPVFPRRKKNFEGGYRGKN
jgi:hypothetical protein